jgi:hypothetical protein
MRDMFPGYLHRTPAEFSAIWRDCVFTFDASFLLDFYRSTSDLQRTLFEILELVKDRVLLTHQSALEYYRNRQKTIDESSGSYRRVSELVRDAVKKIESELKTYRKHTAIDVGKITAIVQKAATDVEGQLQELEKKHPNLAKEDSIEERLARLFRGKVGTPYPESVLEGVYRKAEQRFADRIPPGYKDERQKEGYRRFGDVVLWLQLLDVAKERRAPLILVTADTKEDWWTQDGRPRPELIQEMFSYAGVMFHMYTPAEFVRYSTEYLSLRNKAESLEKAATELKEIESYHRYLIRLNREKEDQLIRTWQAIHQQQESAFRDQFVKLGLSLADFQKNLRFYIDPSLYSAARVLGSSWQPDLAAKVAANMLGGINRSDERSKTRAEGGEPSLGNGSKQKTSADSEPEGQDKEGDER